MSVKAFRTAQVASILLGFMALYVASGWVVGIESMVRVLPSSAAMPLNSAILFFASALCLWPTPNGVSLAHHFWSHVRVACAWLMVALSSAMLAEQAFGVNLGIDWQSLHLQVNDGNPYPGRSAPNACLGFLLAGAAFLVLGRDKADMKQRRLTDILVFATLLVGVSALLINVLNLEALYAIAAYHRMATLSAYGMVVLGLGLWLQLQAQSHAADAQKNPDQRIVRTAVVVLSVVVFGAGLGGFAVLKQGFEEVMSAALLRTTVNSATAFQSIIDQRIVLGRTITERPRLQILLETLSANPQDAPALALAVEVGQSLLSSGISGLRISNAQGDPVAVVGSALGQPAEVEVPVQGSGQKATLLWRDGFVLHTTNAIQRNGKLVGTLVAEQRLAGMTALLRGADGESASTDLLVCGRQADDAVCFPSRFYKANMHIPMYKDGKPYLAISRALLGQKGILFVKDLRGLAVFAGHAPLGESGLGLVFKMDSIDLFAPIRQRLNGFVGLLVLLIGAGTLLLRAQIQPLARKLVSEQRRTGAILESSHEAFIEMDKHGVVQDWNRVAELTFGWTHAEAVGRDLAELIIPPDLREAHRRGMDRFLAEGKGKVLGQRLELLALHREGARFMVEITISAIWQNGEYRFTAFLHAITERKKAEAELLAAKQQAESANVAKGAFLANMSHEIRTPMNAVLGMLQLVQKTALDARQQDYVGKAQSAAKSLLGLLNDILDFSKMDAGKLQLDLHPFGIEGLMRDLAVVLGGNAGNTDVEVIFEIDPALPPVLSGDRLRIQQILINLAGNAVKFTQAGQVVIRLSQIERTAAELTLRVEVSDTGIGIGADQLTRIFDAFTQAEASTTRRFGGTGLGLVISQRLVALMGGGLQVHSVLGEGSRFWFEITLAVENAAEVVVPESLPESLRVLVVEDNPLSREVLVKTLTGMGCTADSAISGAEGVERVQYAHAHAEPYDVVLMDWRMPGMDGLAAASLIRQVLPASQSPVIIMVTAFGREVLADVAQQPDAPFVDFLTKPVTPQQLVAAVHKALAGPVTQANHPSGRLPPVLRLNGLCILLVEDNALNRQVATELLHAEGARVDVAEGGVQGVSMATQPSAAYDVIIMDVQMPDLDGLEATRRIRASATPPHTPILAMTANASPADRRDCLAAGMNDHIAKPIDIDEVVVRLLTLLGRGVDGEPPSPLLAAPVPGGLIESQQTILKRFGHRVELYRNTLSGFKAEIVRLLTELQQHVDKADLALAGATMHAIKGIAATVGALELAKVAADLEDRARAEPGADTVEIFSRDTVASLTDLLQRSDTALAAAMQPGLAAIAPPLAPELLALPPAQLVTRLLEIQALLRAGNLRALDMTEALLELASGADKIKVQELHDVANRLEFGAADKVAQSLLEGLR